MDNIYIPDNDGRWVSENFERLARVIQDYNADFELRYIPEGRREHPEDIQKAFCVYDNRTNNPVLFAHALDTPEQIISRLFEGDTTKHDVLARIEAHNNAVRALELKKEMDELEEAHQIMHFMVTSPKNYLTMRNKDGELVKIDDKRRRVDNGKLDRF